MTQAFEGLARIGGVPSIDGIPGGFGGLSESDRALAMEGLDDLETRIVLTKYLDISELPRLQTTAYLRVTDMVRLYGWPIPKGKEVYRKMSADAVLQFVQPRKCRRCEGRGVVYSMPGRKDLAQKTCPVCEGTGIGQIKGDVHFIPKNKRSAFLKRWDAIYSMLASAESEAAGKMWLKLRW